MRQRIVASTFAGLIAGVVWGLMMQMLLVPMPSGGPMPMIAMAGQIVGSPTIGAGWVYHLFNSAVIGALFGLVIGGHVYSGGPALVWGAVYGFTWWILGGLLLMPALLGMSIVTLLFAPPMWAVAAGSLVGHVVFGMILGTIFEWSYLIARHRAGARA